MKNTMRLSVWLCLSVVLSVSAQAQRPNVLVVMSDDHSAAHLGAYGNADIKTPNLDAFAKEGMLFKRMYVAAPQCVPSRAALMTGRSPVAIHRGLQNLARTVSRDWLLHGRGRPYVSPRRRRTGT
jgi:N-sulfoglucosamine sulfohydrolase